ncbi:MAG: hypothetical protein CVU42_12620 [Chloroflexi bacterium HGW-Chloroflexi-4]|jgi:site-specific DNA recombinase|nr:MAG: hypothetical protein CVU42_12620 [Chloroflexi bacterium HGW-Chloroflexi-4]
MTNTRAIIYARVSTEAQRENYSIPEQIASCKAYIEKKGYQLVGEPFIDSFSGESYPRPALTEALDFYDNFGFDVVIVRHSDRLARDPVAKAGAIYDFCQLREAKFEFIEGGFDDSPEGELASDILTLFARQENSRRAARSKAGKNEKAKQGLFVGGRSPFGYSMNKKVPGGLDVNQDQAKTVKRIFDLYTYENYSIRGITDLLNEERIESYKGGEWQKSTVAKILKSTCYAGYTYYNQRRVIRDKLKNTRITKPRPKEEWIKITGITPIISLDQFNAASEILESNKEIIRKHSSREYLLSGLIFCENCNKPYVCQTAKPNIKSRRYAESKAYRHRKKEKHCINRYITAANVDEMVWAKVINFLENPENIIKGYEAILENQKEQFSKQLEKKEEVIKKIARLEKVLDNLNGAYIDPDIKMSKSEYISKREEIESKQKGFNDQLEKIESNTQSPFSDLEFKNIMDFSKQIKAKIVENRSSTSIKERRELLQKMQTRVFITLNNEIKVELLKIFSI